MNRNIAGLGACLSLIGCATSPIEKKSAGHVIVPSARSISVIGYTQEWTPSEADITELEIELGRLFANPDQRLRGTLMQDKKLPRHAPFPLSDYFIRYAGIWHDGKRVIVGKASHLGERTVEQALTISTPHPNKEETIALDVYGGGTRYFTVTYDAAIRTILDVAYNSPL